MQSNFQSGPTALPPVAPADQYEATFWQQWRTQLSLVLQKPWLAAPWLQQSRTLLTRFNHIYGHLCRQPRPVRRRLQRQLGATLAGAALALTLANMPVQAADFTVNDATSLVVAIHAANDETTNPGADTITLTGDVTLTTGIYEGDVFYSGLPPITSTITIEGNGFTIARDPEAEDPFGLFLVAAPGNLTLNQTTLTGGLSVVGGAILNYDGAVTINQSTITGNIGLVGGAVVSVSPDATMNISNSTFTGNGGAKYGGALTTLGTTTLTDSTVANNANKYLGGSVANLGTLTITGSTIESNTSKYGSGGGILNKEGLLTITSSTVTNNVVTGDNENGGFGGGIFNINGDVTITNSTISGNSSDFSGGGLFNYAYSTPTASVTKRQMPAALSPAAAAKLQTLGIDAARLKGWETKIANLKMRAAASVQAQAADTATMTLINSTVSNNTAGTNPDASSVDDDYGGGIINAYGSLTLQNSTVTGNSAGNGGGIFNLGALTLERSLIAGNSATSAGNEIHNYVSCLSAAAVDASVCLASAHDITADAFNLFGHSGETNSQALYGFTPGASDITATSDGTTPATLVGILNPTLADNGGDTLTHALVSGSPAIDAAGDSGLATDQRGVTRPQGAADDIGAFELEVADTSPLNLIYLSSSNSGRIDGISYRDEDILLYNENTKQWSMFFDGSDVGVGNADLDAFALLADGSILMSFDKALKFPVLGTVKDADIVKFTPTRLGFNTSGSFTRFFEGAAVGLTTGAEDIDAIGYTNDGELLISTSGTARVDALQARDEDLLRFTPTALGTTTAGTWELYFDGSAVGLAASSEDIGAATVDDLGKLYLVTKGKFSAASQTGIQGDSNDIFGCILGATGENSTTCTFFAFFDGELVRFKQAIDGISLGTATTAALAQAAVPTDNGDEPVQFAVIPDEVITDDTEYNEYDLPQAEEIGAEEIRVYLPLISD